MNEERASYLKRRIGFSPGPPSIRMEEEEEAPEASPRSALGRAGLISQPLPGLADRHFDQLMHEREQILDAIEIGKLSPRDKFRLLEENRMYMIILRGGSPYKFRTEKVIYSILVFSAVVLVILAWLNIRHNLSNEVTTTFVGTVVGGTIATIAQKLGKVGR